MLYSVDACINIKEGFNKSPEDLDNSDEGVRIKTRMGWNLDDEKDLKYKTRIEPTFWGNPVSFFFSYPPYSST